MHEFDPSGTSQQSIALMYEDGLIANWSASNNLLRSSRRFGILAWRHSQRRIQKQGENGVASIGDVLSYARKGMIDLKTPFPDECSQL